MTMTQPPASDRRATYELGLVFGLALFVGSLVRHDYWHADFAWDCRYAELFLGLVDTDRMSVANFVLQPWEAHWFPLWNSIYYLLWRVFGLQPLAWRFVAEVWQALSVTALYGLVQFYFQRRLGAFVAALLWASVAIGHWDDPLLYISSNNYVGAMAFFLWAMYAQTQIVGPHAWAWSVAAACCALTSFGLWGISWTWSPVLVLQVLLLRQQMPRELRPGAALVAISMAPIVVWGFLSVTVFLLTRTSGSIPSFVPGQAVGRAMAQLVTSMGHMVGPTLILVPRSHLWWEFLLGAAIVGLACLHLTARPLIALLLLLSLLHLTLVNLYRPGYTLEGSLAQARYLYIAWPFWCVALSAAFTLWSFWQRHSVWAIGICLGLALPIAAHQGIVARAALASFEQRWNQASAVCQQKRDLLRLLAEEQSSSDDPLILADIPIWIPPVYNRYFPLSALHAVCDDEGAEHLTIVPAAWLTDDQVRHIYATLAQQSNPSAARWANLTLLVYGDARALEWLDDLLGQEKSPPPVPDMWRMYDQMHVRYSEIVRFGVGQPLENIHFVRNRDWRPAARDELLARIRARDEPLAKYWLCVFEQVEARPPLPEP